MLKSSDFKSDAENQWCPGCPNFGILTALINAFVQIGINSDQICLVSGIGQAAKLPHYFRSNFYNGLHGRAIPVALGIHITNPDLKTVVVTGDGDCYGEGGNHFLHTIRRNPDITLIVNNNQIYGLTKGQASPTTEPGEKTRLQFEGVELESLNPLGIALLNGCGYVARGFAGDIPHLTNLFVEALQFRGFSYVDVLQPCISWGTHPVAWYKERIYKLPNNCKFEDRINALQKIFEDSQKIPIGLIYKERESRKCFGDYFRTNIWKGKLFEMMPQTDKYFLQLIERFRI
jgi:2-oxoglutarate ferredoxin oxidoreductase subunit beta